jgi:hypothetical protein
LNLHGRSIVVYCTAFPTFPHIFKSLELDSWEGKEKSGGTLKRKYLNRFGNSIK